LDALLIINELNALGPRLFDQATPGTRPGPFLDVSGDGQLTPLDALLVINQLNSSAQGEDVAATEQTQGAAQPTANLDGDWIYYWLAVDREEQRPARKR
jgi:hypothetical protein